VRIFSPAKELPFAGHPTIGTAFVLLQEGIVSRNSSEFSLEEGVGPILLRIEGGPRPLIWMRMPPIREGRCYGSSLRARALGLQPQDLLPMEPQLFSAGNPTVVVAAKDRAAVDRAWLDSAGLKTLKYAEDESFCVTCLPQLLMGPIPGCLRRNTEFPRIRRPEALWDLWRFS